MGTVFVRSIGGFGGSAYPHPQRQLDASLRQAGYCVEALELPDHEAPDYEACMAFLQAQYQGLEAGILILHSLSSRLFLLSVEHLRRHGQLERPLVHTAVLLAPANGRYIADWVPEVAPFFQSDIWVPSLTGAARRLLIAASYNDVYWEEAEHDLDVFRQQPGVDVLVLDGQGHLNEAEVSGDLPDVRAWLQAAQPAHQ
jgi:predicted alpha/beta hydrolase family esterase